MKRLVIYVMYFMPFVCFSQVEKAIQAYKAQDYQTALTEWNRLLDQNLKGAELYYNIGNTYAGLKDFPHAILFYRKALKWDPNCKACIKNLKIAETALGIEEINLPEFILFRFYKSILLTLQASHWFILYSVLLASAILIYFFKDRLATLQIAIRYLALFSFVFLILAIHRDHIRNEKNGFVLVKESALYLSPDQNSGKKIDLKPGQYLEIKDQIQGWIKVQTAELDFGWVELNNGELVQL